MSQARLLDRSRRMSGILLQGLIARVIRLYMLASRAVRTALIVVALAVFIKIEPTVAATFRTLSSGDPGMLSIICNAGFLRCTGRADCYVQQARKSDPESHFSSS